MLQFIDIQFHTLYIGPGLGAGTFAAIVGILVSFLLSMIAVFWYPLKKLYKYLRSKMSK